MTQKSYRDLPIHCVEAYAELHSLNIETQENYREAAQALWEITKIMDTNDWDDFNDDPLEYLKEIANKTEVKPDKEGYLVIMVMVGDDEIAYFYEEGRHKIKIRVPVFFKTEFEAQKEIVDDKISELQSFLSGDRGFEEIVFEPEEYVAYGVTQEDGSVIIYDDEYQQSILFITYPNK